jgi:hypothetical protein
VQHERSPEEIAGFIETVGEIDQRADGEVLFAALHGFGGLCCHAEALGQGLAQPLDISRDDFLG